MSLSRSSGKVATASVPAFVLDASVALAFLLPDEQQALALHLVERAQSDGVLVPAIWPGEVCNSLIVSERRGRFGAHETSLLLGRLLTLLRIGVTLDRPDIIMAVEAQFRLARRHGLTAYDASYLELAIRAQLPLATLDRRLGQAAAAENVPLLG